jgi:riboflavin synthase
MFTGIVEELGTVRQAGSRFSVACAGVLHADLAPETLDRSNLGDLKPGDRVNLERPITLAARLSGHIMQGHVDGTAVLESLRALENGNWEILARVPETLDRYLVFKGSIAIDGISLTIADIAGGLLRVAIIPHTYAATNLWSRHPGDRLNIECDMLAKHVEKLLARIQLPG